MSLKTPLEILIDEIGTHVVDADKCSLAFLGKGEIEYRDMDFMAALIRRANLFDELVEAAQAGFESEENWSESYRQSVESLLQRAKEAKISP